MDGVGGLSGWDNRVGEWGGLIGRVIGACVDNMVFIDRMR